MLVVFIRMYKDQKQKCCENKENNDQSCIKHKMSSDYDYFKKDWRSTQTSMHKINPMKKIKKPQQKTAEVGVMAEENPLKNILSKFNSAQIRKIVSPFYKQRDSEQVYSRQSGSGRASANRNRSRSGERTEITGNLVETLHKCNEDCKCEDTLGDEDKSFQVKKIIIDGKREILKKMEKQRLFADKKFEKVLKRVSVPTQSCLTRTMKVLPEDVRVRKKSAIEYAKREFICECCKRRNKE